MIGIEYSVRDKDVLLSHNIFQLGSISPFPLFSLNLFYSVLLFVSFMIILDRVRDHQNEYDPYNDKQLQKQIADRKTAKTLLR
jgi:flagellar biosynthesis component FlhA